MKASNTQDETFFASAERADPVQLRQNIKAVSQNPVVNTILESVGGLLAILNEHRQILAVNKLMLEAFELDGSKLGLRPGEAINCVYAQDHAGGCGTSQACMSCGAAIAIVTSLNTDEITQQTCFVTLERQGQPIDCYFQVQCSPIVVKGERFLLLFLNDITKQQKRAALERAFFHDVKNLITSLMVSSDLIRSRVDDPTLQNMLFRHVETVSRLGAEIEMQRVLTDDFPADYQLTQRSVVLGDVFTNLQGLFSGYRVALQVRKPPPTLKLHTDVNLLRRILTNMLVNALEASEEGDVVRLWVETSNEAMTFCVWNRTVIPKKAMPRIFQRNFSTKKGSGRGLGTYTMKLFGEKYLGGTVDFTSSEQEGTVFRLAMPVAAASASA